MKEKHKGPTIRGRNVVLSVNIPIPMWQQVETRVALYDIPFSEWLRRVLQAELDRPARQLPGLAAEPKEAPRDQNLKQAPTSHTPEVLAALDRAYDRIGIEGPGNDEESIKTLRKLFGELKGILGKPETWTTKLE